jgi:hypothetical protein
VNDPISKVASKFWFFWGGDCVRAGRRGMGWGGCQHPLPFGCFTSRFGLGLGVGW